MIGYLLGGYLVLNLYVFCAIAIADIQVIDPELQRDAANIALTREQGFVGSGQGCVVRTPAGSTAARAIASTFQLQPQAGSG